jgi:hypothetical protein
VQTEQTIGRPLPPWSGIDWAVAAEAVRRLQERIFRAAKDGDFGKVKNLQKLLVRSRSANLLAIRQMTQQCASAWKNPKWSSIGVDRRPCHEANL